MRNMKDTPMTHLLQRGANRVLEIIGTTLVFVAVIAIVMPYMLKQQESVRQTAVQADARALAIEVAALLGRADENFSGPQPLVWDPQTRALTLQQGGDLDPLVGSLTMTDGSRLANDEPANNLVTSATKFCVAVNNGELRAYRDQNGPAESC